MQPPFDLNLMTLKRHDPRELIAQAEVAHLREKISAETKSHGPGKQIFGSVWKLLIERAVGSLTNSHP